MINEEFFLFDPAATTTCDPQKDCAKAKPGDLVPDPKNCYNYYVCVSTAGGVTSSDTSFACPDGQYFDTTSAKCADETTPCQSVCGGQCSLSCSEALDVLGFPGNCSKYYVCIFGGGRVLTECPVETPYFNGENCTTNSATCCDFCSATCDQIGVQIPDPLDCRSYYVCVQTGPANPDYRGTCDHGQIFDSNLGECTAGTTCTPLCPSTPTTTTSSPITTTTGSSGDKCPNSFKCTQVGNFPRCNFCDKSYFHCSQSSGPGKIQNCPSSTVFNTNSEYPSCILPTNCPYPN